MLRPRSKLSRSQLSRDLLHHHLRTLTVTLRWIGKPKLQHIMKNIFKAAYNASVECGCEGNLVVGANVAGFLKVYDAMKWQGVAY